MHFILLSDVENDQTDAILEGNLIDPEIEDFSFSSGFSVEINKNDLPIVFLLDEYNLRGRMTDHLSIDNIPGPILSSKVKVLFDKAGQKNIQYFPLKIIDEFAEQEGESKSDNIKEASENSDYFIANVVGLLDCVDHEKSVLEYFYPPELRNQKLEEISEGTIEINDPFADENPNDIDFITKLFLDETKIDPTLKIFRLKDQPNLLVFHESVVAQIRKEGLTGFVFIPVEEYTDAIPDEVINSDKPIEPIKKEVPEEPKKSDAMPASDQKEEKDETKKKRVFFQPFNDNLKKSF